LTGSELKAVEEACREASRTVEPWNVWNGCVISWKNLRGTKLETAEIARIDLNKR
jgi:hypothetical protein